MRRVALPSFMVLGGLVRPWPFSGSPNSEKWVPFYMKDMVCSEFEDLLQCNLDPEHADEIRARALVGCKVTLQTLMEGTIDHDSPRVVTIHDDQPAVLYL